MTNDPYRALGLNRSASAADLKKSYRRLAQAHHPDRRPGDKRAEERFKDISAAYELLSDPVKRRQFDAGQIDAMGNARAGYGAGGYGAGFGGASQGYGGYGRSSHGAAQNGAKGGGKRPNPFNSFFRDRPEKSRQSIKARGADVHYTLKITFLESALGALKELRMASNKTLKVNIPAGSESGHVLRLKGQGMKGLGGGAAGDALVKIRIQSDRHFRAEGLDVYSEEPVTLGEALLGGQIEVQTIHGALRVTVPEGSNSGTTLRLKAKGIHPHGATARGDHYVSLKVMLPEGDDSDLKKFVKKWIGKRPYKVRKDKVRKDAARDAVS